MITIDKPRYITLFAPIILVSLFFLSGCSKQKAKEDMNFEELKGRTSVFLEKQKYQEAADLLESIIMKNPERPDIHKFKMTLADTYFKLERYPSAFQLYQNYEQLYPSHEKAEYAKYQAVLSKFYQTLKIDCDQTVTGEAINICKEYTANNHYKKYVKDVIDIQNTCEHKLINKEIYVFNFYLGRNELKAAKSRLKYIKDTFLAKQPSLEPRLCYLECKLAKEEKDIETLTEKRTLLAQRYPNSQFTHMTDDLFNKPTFQF